MKDFVFPNGGNVETGRSFRPLEQPKVQGDGVAHLREDEPPLLQEGPCDEI